jgi:hypothetical protein
MDVQPAPWATQGIVHGYVFYLNADVAALQALCDRCLNAPSNNHLRYRPVDVPLFGHYVALTFQHFDRLLSDPNPKCGYQKGMHSYNEASFWVPVAREAADGSQGPLEMFIPYMFVDNWIALATGREVYGFPKEYADELVMPKSGAGPFHISALTLDEVSKPVPAVRKRILKCEPSSKFKPSPGFLALQFPNNLWPLIEEGGLLLEPYARELFGPIQDIIKILLAGELPLVFLRQMRAVGAGNAADLLQIVAAKARPFEVQNFKFISPHTLDLASLESHPIAEDLGLPGGKLESPIAVELEIKFGLQPGVVVWP